MALTPNRSDDGDAPECLVEINTTPLIDVMLVLLIMLIITIPLQTHAVKLTVAEGAPSALPPEAVTIDIAADGTVLWNHQAVADPAALESLLRAAASAPSQPDVRLRPNRLAPYRSVATVLAAAQRLGMTRIAILSEPG